MYRTGDLSLFAAGFVAACLILAVASGDILAGFINLILIFVNLGFVYLVRSNEKTND